MKHFSCSLIVFFLFIFSSRLIAGSFLSGEVLSVDSTLNKDTYIACKSLTVNKAVKGDLVVAAQTIFIRDTIFGDLSVAGENVTVAGFVTDDIRNFARIFTLRGGTGGDVIVFSAESYIPNGVSVGGDLVVFSGEVHVDGIIEGNLIVRGGKVFLSGTVKGGLKVSGGEVTLEGTITGPSQLAGEKLYIKDNAKFVGDVNYWRHDGEIRETKFTHQGKFVFDPSLKTIEDKKPMAGFAIFWFVWSLLAGFLFLMLLNFLFPSLFAKAGYSLGLEGAKNFGVGILYVLLVPFVCLFLFFTVIGIPIGLMLLFFYIFTLFSGLIIASLVLTYYLRNRYHKDWSKWATVGWSLLVLLGLHIILMIPVIGFIATLILVPASFGALIIHARRKDRDGAAVQM